MLVELGKDEGKEEGGWVSGGVCWIRDKGRGMWERNCGGKGEGDEGRGLLGTGRREGDEGRGLWGTVCGEGDEGRGLWGKRCGEGNEREGILGKGMWGGDEGRGL